jgi:nitroreductase
VEFLVLVRLPVMSPPNPSALQALLQRLSVPSRLLGEPGPDEAQLHTLLTAAVRVPDHGKLTPWRFLRIRGDERRKLGDVLAARQLERDPEAPPAVVEKDRQRFDHAPLVLAVVGVIVPGHKVPEQEQLLSAGCSCFALLQAAQALGFGAQWLTGWAAYDPAVAARLGLAAHERIVGFIHIGTPREPAPERPRPDPLSLLADWHG